MLRSIHIRRGLPLLLAVAVLAVAGESDAFLLVGTVRNAANQPVAGVDIDAENAATGESVPLVSDATNASGYYDILLPPGTYNIGFTPPAGQALVGQERTNIVVMSPVVTLNATLPSGFFLFGTVRNPALQPLAGVDIDVRDAVTDLKLFIPHDDSDLNGFYTIVVPAGTYKVLFRPTPSTTFPVRVFTPIAVSQDRNLDCTLQSGVRLFGTARDPKSNPLRGVTLNVFDGVTGAKVWIYGSASDSLGSYQAALLPGFHYDLVYNGPAGWGFPPIPVDSLLIASNTQRDVQFLFPFHLSGRVQSAMGGLDVPSVRIDVFSHALNQKLPIASNSTDLFGNYDVRVPAGLMDVTFRSPEGNGLASHIVRNLTILDDTQLDAQLVTGTTVTGRVRAPGGVGQANVDFDIVDPVTRLEVPVFDDDTDALGDYTLVLPAGSYDLDLDPGHGVRLVAQVLLGLAVPHAAPLDFQLEPGVLLSGRVLDHIQNPWPDTDIDVRIANTFNEIVTPGDNTDARGDYLVTVPAGTFDLVFHPPLGAPADSLVVQDVVIAGDLVFNATLTSTLIGVDDPGAAPGRAGLVLEPSAPNPFNPSTRLGFTLGEAGPAVLRIYDVAGRVVRTLAEGPLAAGRHDLVWDGRDGRGGASPSGVYFLRLETRSGARTQKIVLAR